jgi:hypothetical protein
LDILLPPMLHAAAQDFMTSPWSAGVEASQPSTATINTAIKRIRFMRLPFALLADGRSKSFGFLSQ